MDELKEKHPDGHPTDESVIIKDEIPPFVNPAIFNILIDQSIMKAAIKTRGTSGPSGMDTNAWRRILVSKSFGQSSKDLCSSIAKMAKTMCTNVEDVVTNP